MRDDGDFFRDLRNEIVITLGRRQEYTKYKLLFLMGLLGVGAGLGSKSPVFPLAYLTTVVVMVFDLFIMGADFSAKRAGVLLRQNLNAPLEEQRWERLINECRDSYSAYANSLSSMIVLIAATIGLWSSEHESVFFWCWVIMNFITAVLLEFLKKHQRETLEKFAIDVLRDI